MSVSCGGAAGREKEADYSRERALKCGVCESCGVLTNCDAFGRLCTNCRKFEIARADAHNEQHREEWERQAAQRRAVRDKQLDDILADLSKVKDTDWGECEDLAVELMPKVLSRLHAIELAMRTKS